MIGKQIKGRGFRGLLNYLESKADASLIGGNMSGRNSQELAREFRISRQLNPDADRVVYHASLSLQPGERLDDDTWSAIAERYLDEMGFNDNQYTVYRHFDTEHDHIHITASRIRLDTGRIVHDSWDYLRSEKIIRQIEKDYGLQPNIGSREKKARTASTGQHRRVKKELAEYEFGARELPPSPPVKEQLQELIKTLTADEPSMPELIAKLLIADVEVRCEFTRTGKSKGISYSKNGVSFSGTNLGAAFTWTGLQKHLGVQQFLKQDQWQIQMLYLRMQASKAVDDNYIMRIAKRRESYANPNSEEFFIPDIQYDYAAQIAPVLKSFWESKGSPSRIKGKNYQLEVAENYNELILTRLKDKKIVANISLDERFESRGVGLNLEDVQQILANQLINAEQPKKVSKRLDIASKSSNNSKSQEIER